MHVGNVALAIGGAAAGGTALGALTAINTTKGFDAEDIPQQAGIVGFAASIGAMGGPGFEGHFGTGSFGSSVAGAATLGAFVGGVVICSNVFGQKN